MSKIYIWRAAQSEPGCDGYEYAATSDHIPPVDRDPVHHASGLIYQESLYDPWRLAGYVEGDLRQDADGELYIAGDLYNLYPAEVVHCNLLGHRI